MNSISSGDVVVLSPWANSFVDSARNVIHIEVHEKLFSVTGLIALITYLPTYCIQPSPKLKEGLRENKNEAGVF